MAFFLGVLSDFARDLYWIAVGENAVAQQVVDAAFRVHTRLGPGLLESVYEAALAYELEKRGLRITRQQGIPVVYEGPHPCWVLRRRGGRGPGDRGNQGCRDRRAGAQEATSHLSEAG